MINFLKNPKYLLAIFGLVLAGGVAYYVYQLRKKASVPSYQSLATTDAPVKAVAAATDNAKTPPAPIPAPSPTTVPSGLVAGETYGPVSAAPIGNVNPAEVADETVVAPIAASGMESELVYPTYSSDEYAVSGFFSGITSN